MIFGVLEVMTVKITDFWNVTPYSLVDDNDDSENVLPPSSASKDLHPEDRDSTFLRNIGKHLLD
jgi:hypothetical protein